MYRRVIASVGLLIAIACLLAGCDSVKKLIQGTPVINHVVVSAKVAQPGAQLQGSLNAKTPSDLPVWAGAAVMRNKVTKSGSWSATFSTTDKYQDVAKGMVVGFQKAGWQVEAQDSGSGDQSSTVMSVTGPSGTGIVTIAELQDKTTRMEYVLTLEGR